MYARGLHNRLAEVAGDDWYLNALLVEAALDQDRDFVAGRHLRKLRKLDPPPDVLVALEHRYHQEVPAFVRGVGTALVWIRIIVMLWLVLTPITIGLGVAVAMLQRRAVAAWTPRSVDEPPRVPLRKLSLVLLRAFRVLYVAALLMLALALLLFGLAAFAAMYLLPGLFKATMIAIFLFDMAAIGAILQAGLFRRIEPPGFRHNITSEPQLLALSQAAATAMRVAPAVDLHFTTDARLELLWHPRKTLVIGIALIDTLDTDQFNALLCREYARTRASGGAGHLVAPMLMRTTQELASQATHLRFANPAWYLLHAFRWSYRLIGNGAAREQDLLADRWAATAHGSSRLADAIVTHADIQVRFAATLVAIEAELPRRGGILANIYTHTPDPRPSEQSIATDLDRHLATADPLTNGLPPNARIPKLEALALPPPQPTSPQPLAKQVHARASLQVTATNTYRIALERRLNKFIRLDPELEATINRQKKFP